MCMWEIKPNKESQRLQTWSLGREKEYWERCMVHASSANFNKRQNKSIMITQPIGVKKKKKEWKNTITNVVGAWRRNGQASGESRQRKLLTRPWKGWRHPEKWGWGGVLMWLELYANWGERSKRKGWRHREVLMKYPLLSPWIPLKMQSVAAKLSSFPTHWSSTGVRISCEKLLCTE